MPYYILKWSTGLWALLPSLFAVKRLRLTLEKDASAGKVSHFEFTSVADALASVQCNVQATSNPFTGSLGAAVHSSSSSSAAAASLAKISGPLEFPSRSPSSSASSSFRSSGFSASASQAQGAGFGRQGGRFGSGPAGYSHANASLNGNANANGPLKYGSSFESSSSTGSNSGIKNLLYNGLVGTDSKKNDPLKCSDGKGSRLYIDQIQSCVDNMENSEKVSDFKTRETLSKKRELDFSNEVEEAAQRMESNWIDRDALHRACRMAEEKGSGINILMNADGGSRGNPGLSASSATAKVKVQWWKEDGSVVDEDFPLFKRSRFIGLAQTNNVAEYRAFVLMCLNLQDLLSVEMEKEELKAMWKELSDQKRIRVSMFMDSQLVVRQMLGEYAVSSATMIIENASARRAFDHLCSVLGNSRDNVSLEHVKRAKNSEPDVLCNKLMNEIELKFPTIAQDRKKAKIESSNSNK